MMQRHIILISGILQPNTELITRKALDQKIFSKNLVDHKIIKSHLTYSESMPITYNFTVFLDRAMDHYFSYAFRPIQVVDWKQE